MHQIVDHGVGAVLSQHDNGELQHPVFSFSWKLLTRKECYSTIGKECLAIKLRVQAFRVYVPPQWFKQTIRP